MGIMLWSSIFIICIVQGLFLISLIAFKKSANTVATRSLLALLWLMIINNFVYLFIRTGAHNYFPQVYGISVGEIFLYGPLFYFYSKAVTDKSFRWKKKYWLHFIPYSIQLVINLPYYTIPKANWVWYVDTYMAGQLPIETKEKIILALQALHLFAYLFVIFRWLRILKMVDTNGNYLIPLQLRLKWLTALASCFTVLSITLTGLYIFVLVTHHYNPVTNYINTIIMSGIIYFIAGKLVVNGGLISPDFREKYKSYKPLKSGDEEKYVHQLHLLMNEQKIFTNPGLKLAVLARHLDIPPYQLSKLINEKFGKTFTDYINEYRVREFEQRVNDPNFNALSIYGIALDVGFSSKSSFNTVFKKITGKTPSELKVPL